jgi:hypothetical protein
LPKQQSTSFWSQGILGIKSKTWNIGWTFNVSGNSTLQATLHTLSHIIERPIK